MKRVKRLHMCVRMHTVYFCFYPPRFLSRPSSALISCLPLRSWWTIRAPSVQGPIPICIFRFSICMAAVGFEPLTS